MKTPRIKQCCADRFRSNEYVKTERPFQRICQDLVFMRVSFFAQTNMLKTRQKTLNLSNSTVIVFAHTFLLKAVSFTSKLKTTSRRHCTIVFAQTNSLKALSFTSKKNQGTSFFIRLPLQITNPCTTCFGDNCRVLKT